MLDDPVGKRLTLSVPAVTFAIMAAAAACRWLLVVTSGLPCVFTGILQIGPYVVASLCLLAYVSFRDGLKRLAVPIRAVLLMTVLLAYLPESNEAVMHMARERPYADNALAQVDAFLGFDWLVYVRLLDSHPIVWTACSLAYKTIWIQIIGIAVFLGLRKSSDRLYVFFGAQALSLSTTCAIGALFPALGAYVHWDASHAGFIHHDFVTADNMTLTLQWLRSAEWAALPVDLFHGIVSFPSYHAICCVLFAWATWDSMILRYPSCALNSAMFAATPVQGSHYLVDMILGVCIATTAIVVVKKFLGCFSHSEPEIHVGNVAMEDTLKLGSSSLQTHYC